jgi:hypothetical protein
MKAKLLGAVSAAVLLGSVGIANAQGPMQLTDTQLDNVTAGVAVAEVIAVARGGTTSNGAFTLAANNTSATAGTALAAISASFTPTGLAPHTLALLAFASAP